MYDTIEVPDFPEEFGSRPSDPPLELRKRISKDEQRFNSDLQERRNPHADCRRLPAAPLIRRTAFRLSESTDFLCHRFPQLLHSTSHSAISWFGTTASSWCVEYISSMPLHSSLPAISPDLLYGHREGLNRVDVLPGLIDWSTLRKEFVLQLLPSNFVQPSSQTLSAVQHARFSLLQGLYSSFCPDASTRLFRIRQDDSN